METFFLCSFLLSLNILVALCDETCDCGEINLLKEIVQKDIFERKLESSRLQSRIRRIEATQRAIPATVEVPRLGLEDLHEKIDTKFAEIDFKLNDLLREKSEDQRNMVDIVSKSFVSEKKKRIRFISDIETQMTAVRKTVVDFKAETINYIEQCKSNITEYQNDFRQDISSKLDDLKKETDLNIDNIEQDLREANTKVSKLNDEAMTGKTDGGWSHWSSWVTCSETCGGGTQSQTRTCTNPKPSLLGKQCEGSSVKDSLCNQQTCPDRKVAFTAYGISGTGSTVLVFPNVIQNYGNGYSGSTGKFTCSVSGIYHFNVQISKKWGSSVDQVRCVMLLNSVPKVSAVEDPFGAENDKNGYSLSLSATFYLNRNDTVYVGRCGGISGAWVNSYTSFNGFLVTPDN